MPFALRLITRNNLVLHGVARVSYSNAHIEGGHHTEALEKTNKMQAYKKEFIDLALELGVLRFGEFTLKSGRVSPYFFNAGLFNTGYAAARLGRYYAAAIAASKIKFDMLFGPAYKGIPLAALTAASLAEHQDLHGRRASHGQRIRAYLQGRCGHWKRRGGRDHYHQLPLGGLLALFLYPQP